MVLMNLDFSFLSGVFSDMWPDPSMSHSELFHYGNHVESNMRVQEVDRRGMLERDALCHLHEQAQIQQACH